MKDKYEVNKIEHNIPVPNNVKGRVSRIARQMKLGDSVIIHFQDVAALRMAMKRMGFKCHMQAVGLPEQQLARCWMIKI